MTASNELILRGRALGVAQLLGRHDVKANNASSIDVNPGYRSPLLMLRQGLELFANVRPCRSLAHATSRPNLDLLIVRENTKGLYTGDERVSEDGEAANTERVITRLTIVNKANVLRAMCGLFRRTALEVAADDPDLDVDELLVDACARRLMKDPERFGTLVTTNLFGDILSDQASMLVGGLGNDVCALAARGRKPRDRIGRRPRAPSRANHARHGRHPRDPSGDPRGGGRPWARARAALGTKFSEPASNPEASVESAGGAF